MLILCPRGSLTCLICWCANATYMRKAVKGVGLPPPTAKRAKDEMWVSALWLVTLRTKSNRDLADLCPLFFFFFFLCKAGWDQCVAAVEIHLYLWGLGQKGRMHPFRTLCFTARCRRVMNCSASIHCQRKTNNLYCASLQVTGTEAYCDFILWSFWVLFCSCNAKSLYYI